MLKIMAIRLNITMRDLMRLILESSNYASVSSLNARISSGESGKPFPPPCNPSKPKKGTILKRKPKARKRGDESGVGSSLRGA
jgi:hypothetical protein